LALEGYFSERLQRFETSLSRTLKGGCSLGFESGTNGDIPRIIFLFSSLSAGLAGDKVLEHKSNKLPPLRADIVR